MTGLVHYNPALKHQRDHAFAFASIGFHATTNPYKDADIHVISGPWYCRDYWNKHPRVLKIDRAWWGDPACVSIGWLQQDGSRKFAQGRAPRPKPEMHAWTQGDSSCLILSDYRQDISEIQAKARKRFRTVHVRPHPAECRASLPLEDDIQCHDVVVGTSGTALFEAIRLGVPVVCLDPKNDCAPVCTGSFDAPLVRPDRTRWLHDMSYKQFSLDEIETAWELLKEVQL